MVSTKKHYRADVNPSHNNPTEKIDMPEYITMCVLLFKNIILNCSIIF